MAEPFSSNPRAVDQAGLFAHLSAFVAAKLGYLRARLKLAGIEGKEAGIHLAIILGLAICGLVAIIFGYFLLVLSLVFIVGFAFDGEHAWIWVLLAAAILHFVGAGILVLIAKARISMPLFPLTLDEIQKDQEWLKTATKPN